MNGSLRKWMRWALINLMIVALIGVVLRYKIAFSLPIIDQKNLLHGHSHFAFAGWVSMALMALLIANLPSDIQVDNFVKYKWLLNANLLTAYGMLISFPIQGYGFVAIVFSTLNIFVTYSFTIVYWKDTRKFKAQEIAPYWFKTALLWNCMSSAGPFALAFMMASKHIPQNWYLGSIYFYLHFQYNGWFFFAIMGLMSARLQALGMAFSELKKIFLVFAYCFIPALFLSVLWWNIPTWLYVLVVAAAIGQLIGAWQLFKAIYQLRTNLSMHLVELHRKLFVLAGVAFFIKLCLQTGSVIPSLSHLAFGFRPIVIGYLHLVLLGVITLFILTYSFSSGFIIFNKTSRSGLVLFVGGIILNEFLLMVQGSAGLAYIGMPYMEWWLLGAAIVLFTGMAIVNYGQYLKPDPDHKTLVE